MFNDKKNYKLNRFLYERLLKWIRIVMLLLILIKGYLISGWVVFWSGILKFLCEF